MQRRQLVQSGAWLLATCAAVTLSWFGVHTVVEGTAYDPPQALPVSEQVNSPFTPRASSTHRPKPSGSPSPPPSTRPPARETGEQREPGGGPRAGTQPEEAPGPGTAAGSGSDGVPQPESSSRSGNVQGTTVAGGRVVFDVGDDSAALVSATPNEGWDMKVWKTSTWIRVTFTKGHQASSVFCRWDQPPPRIEQFDG